MPREKPENAGQSTAVQLRERLAAALPMTGIVMDRLTEALDGVRRDLLPVSGKLLCDLLVSASTELTVLETIKNHGKRLATSDSERETGLTIYFAAIASALLFHGQKITTHSYDTLDRSFASLARKPWITPELARLFEQAMEKCVEME